MRPKLTVFLFRKKILSFCLLIGVCSLALSYAEPLSAGIVTNPGFESEEGWILELLNGAQGRIERDTSVSRNGKHSLKVVKTNSLGQVVVRSAKPVNLKFGSQYLLRGYFRSEDAPLSSLLLFRLGSNNAAAIKNPYGLYHYVAHGLIPNSPSDHWEKRIVKYTCSREPSADPSIARNVPASSYVYVVLAGNPCTVWLDDITIEEGKRQAGGNLPKYDFSFSQTEVFELLQKRQISTLKLETQPGRTVLLDENGNVVPPAFYFSNRNTETEGDYEDFGKAGVDSAIVTIRLGLVWQARDKYNFSKIDEAILMVLRKNSNANLILNLSVNPYEKWGEEHPGECWMNSKGQRVFRASGDGSAKMVFADSSQEAKAALGAQDVFMLPSYHSSTYQKEMADCIRLAVEHIKDSPFSKSVVGFLIMGALDGRFQMGPPDFSNSALLRFQQWCEEKYGTTQQLSHAWGREISSFQDIEIPAVASIAVFSPSLSAKPYMTDRSIIDYRTFRAKDVWDVIDLFAGVAKTAIGKPAIAATYRELDAAFTRTKHIDIIGNDFNYYSFRHPGYATGWCPPEVWFHDKMIFQDIDLRSFAGPQISDEEYEQWVGAVVSPEQWREAHRKLVGLSLANGAGYWYYDMLAYFRDEFIMTQIAETQQVNRRLLKVPWSPLPVDVAVVIDDSSENNRQYHSVYHNVATVNHIQRMMLQTSGVPFKTYYVDDIMERPEFLGYKIIIFLHVTEISREVREFINQKLKNNQRTLVWVYDSGYIEGGKPDAMAMSDLIGIGTKTEERFARLTPMMNVSDSPITKDVPPLIGLSELDLLNFQFAGIATSFAPAQPFWIEDGDAEAMASYHEDGKVAMAQKDFESWKSIYIASPNSLTDKLLNNIAKSANALRFGDSGQLIASDGTFLMIHGLQQSNYRFNLPPGKSRIINADSGETVAENVTEWIFPIVPQKTYFYFLE